MNEPTSNTNDTTAEPVRPRRDRHGPSWPAVLMVCFALIAALVVGVRYAEALRAGYERAKTAILDAGDDGAETTGDDNTYYTCGMHPWVVLPDPGSCPVCQMDLVPIDPSKFKAEIAIDPVVVQNMGVRVEPVTTGPLTRTIRTVGTVDYDETRVRDVNIKVSGWVEKLHVDFLGQRVEQGQPLFELYSPQLYQAQEEYLLAWRSRNRGGASGSSPTADGQTPMLRSARTRLEYFDITDDQIEALKERGRPAKTMTIRSPHGGTVIDKHANEGMKIDPGMRVYRIADLSEVWVMVTLYEQQLPYISEGQHATMRLSYIPGRALEGRVIYIDPFLQDKTRQAKVRLEFENPDGLLKPGMFANVELRSELAERATLVPRSAVIDTGQRQVAFVSQGGGKFEPRDVKLGAETNGEKVQVLDGLEPGEMVVTSGQFMLDSEARMREALVKMIEGQSAADPSAAAPVIDASPLDDLPDQVAERLIEMLEAYFTIGEALASNELKGVEQTARRLTESTGRLIETEIPDHPDFWQAHEEAATARGKARELTETTALEEARLIYADLSAALEKLLRATGVPRRFDAAVHRLHCPMYPEDQDGSIWLQPAGDVRNPFMGPRMIDCFDRRHTMPATGGEASGKADEPAKPSDEDESDQAEKAKE